MRKPRSPLPLPAAFPGSLLPWSYSKLSTYEKCPAQAKFRYLEKRPEEKSPAMERGNRVHAEFEEWMHAGAPKVATGPCVKFAEIGTSVVSKARRSKSPLVIEELWGHDRSWQPTTHRGSTHLWVKMDLCSPAEALVVDWKTGKKYDSHVDQGLLYGVSFLLRYTNKPRVRVAFAYTDLGEVSDMDVERKEVKAITADFDARVKTMVQDTRHAPKPSKLCGWCGYSKTKGGPCLAG